MRSGTDPEAAAERPARALGPIAAGLLLDLVDLGTFGPIGLYGGFVAGGVLGGWLGSRFGLSRRARIALAIVAAAYTATPATELLPLGTILGTIAKLRGG